MADAFYELQKEGILKRVVYGGQGDALEFPDGAKATFHYRVTKVDDEKTLLDDSRNDGKPLELIFGKKFKMEVWERVLKTMRLKEVSEFTCDIKHSAVYPVVAKSLRDIHKKKNGHSCHGHDHAQHSCGMMALASHGMGYDDLDQLMKDPQPLNFTIELLKLEMPEQYEKETWVMTADEKLESIPTLRDEGNKAYGSGDLELASKKYSQALAFMEDLMLQEKPGDVEWKKLDDTKRQLLLNFCQCKLRQKDYYTVITHASDVLEREPDNIKALFRRAKAHAAVWNVAEARSDFDQAIALDPSLESAAKKELTAMDERVKEKEKQEKSRLKGMFS